MVTDFVGRETELSDLAKEATQPPPDEIVGLADLDADELRRLAS